MYRASILIISRPCPTQHVFKKKKKKKRLDLRIVWVLRARSSLNFPKFVIIYNSYLFCRVTEIVVVILVRQCVESRNSAAELHLLNDIR